MTASDILSVDALPAPDIEVELRRQLGQESYQLGYEDGYAAGAVAMAESYKAAILRRYADARLEALRWTVLCGRCRRNGRRDGCTGCEVRDPISYGKPHPDDFQGQPG